MLERVQEGRRCRVAETQHSIASSCMWSRPPKTAGRRKRHSISISITSSIRSCSLYAFSFPSHHFRTTTPLSPPPRYSEHYPLPSSSSSKTEHLTLPIAGKFGWKREPTGATVHPHPRHRWKRLHQEGRRWRDVGRPGRRGHGQRWKRSGWRRQRVASGRAAPPDAGHGDETGRHQTERGFHFSGMRASRRTHTVLHLRSIR